MHLPGEKTVLFDGGFSYYDRGGYVDESVVTPFLPKSGVTKINYLILTSLDKDHLEGAKTILRKFRVERLWTNGGKLDSEVWEIIRDKNISWKNILDEFETLDIEGVQIEFLKPRGKFTADDSSKPFPLVGKLTFEKVGFLFGESLTEKRVQDELLETYRDRIESSVLYIPRVPDRQKDISDFIRAVSPRIIVSNTALRNLSNPPDMRILNSRENPSPSIFPIDENGSVTMLTDGKQIRVKTFFDENREFVY